MADYFTVRESFSTRLGGGMVEYHAGEVVGRDDPAFRKAPHLFAPLIVRGVVEQATAAPGEKRKLGLRKPREATAAEEVAVAETVRAEAETSQADAESEPAGHAVSLASLKGRT
jgi:hypothetical protein